MTATTLAQPGGAAQIAGEREEIEIVRLPRPILFPIAAALGACVVVLPAVASSETSPTINAESSASCGPYSNCWKPPTATVGAGGSVTFQNASGVPHGVVWESGPTTPVCNGVPVDSSSTSFKGTCTFSQAGTYDFYCYVHGRAMSGTVTVSSSGTTTTTTTTPTPTATTTTTSTPSTLSNSSNPSTASPAPAPPVVNSVTGATGSPLAGSATSAVKLRSIQRGKTVHGSIEVSQAGAGGKLEVRLLARRASLASAGHQVQVGHAALLALAPGTVSFAVALNARARRALRRRHHLALTVKILLSAPRGSPVTITRSIDVRS